MTKKRATAQAQDLLIKPVEHDIIDEINIGDTKMRLCSSHSGKSMFIQLWSSLSNQWNTTHRYNVETEWNKWKRYALLYSNKSKDRRRAGIDVQLSGSGEDPKRKPRSTAKASGTETGGGNRRRKIQNP